MSFYELLKEDRDNLVHKIENEIKADFLRDSINKIIEYFSDTDTYIRKAGYLSVGKIYYKYPPLKEKILTALIKIFREKDEKVRQTVVNAVGEIGKSDANQTVIKILEDALSDEHHKVRNAVIGSLKKMGEVNPQPVIKFSKKYLHHPDWQVRRQVIHCIELRGRTHPEEVLPLLKEVQNDQNRVVKNMIVHVLGQISYKYGCLEKVITELKTWENKEIVNKAIKEILDTHIQYKDFSYKSYSEAKEYIERKGFITIN